MLKGLSNAKYWHLGGYFLLAVICTVLTFTIVELNLSVDFKAFYLSSKSFEAGKLPYLYSKYENLNPPFFILLTYPLSWFSFSTALIVWQTLSIMALIAGGKIVLKYVPQVTSKWLFALGFSYAFLVNIYLGQVGSFVFYIVIKGYYAYKNDKIALTGVLWGVVSAIKLFPLLLLIYCLVQKKYRLSGYIIAIFVFASSLPFLIWGSAIYQDYFEGLQHAFWYGHNWNMSLIGFINRLLIHGKITPQKVDAIRVWFRLAFVVGFIIYLYLMTYKRISLNAMQTWSLTLIAMLILSPLGWLYYLPLVFFPYLLLYHHAYSIGGSHLVYFYLMSLLLFLPQEGLTANELTSWRENVTIHSQYFFGLCWMAWMVVRYPKINAIEQIERKHSDGALFISTAIVVFVVGMTLYRLIVHTAKLYLQHLG